jgi:hypothetical protein
VIHIRRRRQQIGQAAERHRAFGAQEFEFVGQPLVLDRTRRPEMPDTQVVFRLRLTDGLEVADEFADIVFLPGKRESPRIEGARVPRGCRRVFHCILIREVATGRAPTPTIFSSTPRKIFAGAGQRRSQVQQINLDRTGLAVGGRRPLVLYRIGLPATAPKSCRRRMGSALGDDEGLAAAHATRGNGC